MISEEEYFKSEEFKKISREIIEKETWDKDLPMIYIDKDGNVVKHWKDGTVKIIKENDRRADYKNI